MKHNIDGYTCKTVVNEKQEQHMGNDFWYQRKY